MVETAKTGEANKQARDQSTIQFPYGDMSDAIAVAQGIMKCGGGGKRTLHPFIQGLLDTLPEQGTLWTVEGRAAWLQAAAQNFTLIYKGEGKIDIHAVTTTQRPEKAA